MMMMRMMMRLLLLFITLLFLITTFSNAQQLSPPSYCGDIEIRCPFSLNTNPVNCGDFDTELQCDTNNNNVLIFLDSQKYRVKSIDYKTETIRIVDPGTPRTTQCSFFFPANSLSGGYLYFCQLYAYRWGDGESYEYLSSPVVFVSCSRRVNSTMYVEDSTSSNSHCYYRNNNDNAYLYALLGTNLKVSDLEESCRIELIGWVSNEELPGILLGNTSFSTILHAMSNGFTLTWDHTISSKWYLIILGWLRQILYGLLWVWYMPKGTPVFWNPGYGYLVVDTIMDAMKLGVWIITLRFVCGVTCLIILIIYKCKRRHLSAYDYIEDFLQGQNNFVAVRYSYSDIKKITNNFKKKLGEGGFGSVYKGKLRSGIFVAVKMMNKSKANGKDFMNEVATIGRIHHVNVVQLIGFCVEGSKRALLYEFMPNGSLEKYIFSQEDGNISLSYDKMFEISLGVARGIDYLHKGCDMQILHFDIKPHNILLDENFTPKISDFGLAKLHSVEDSMVSLTAARGTMGYMAPELFYKNIGRVSYKADVYSYGMLLMEMVGKRRNLNPFVENLSQIYFPTWVYDQFNKGKDICIADVSGKEEREMVKKMVLVGLWCIQMNPIDRPSMDKIVEMLQRGDGSVPMPPKPLLCPDQLPTNEDHHDHEIQVENN